MHRLPKAARPTAVIVGLLVALLVPAVVEARGQITAVPHPSDGRPWTADAAELAATAPQAIKHGTTDKSCTGWRSTFTPPATIRVLRTRGANSGHVEQVDFRTYVGVVIAAEWPSRYPLEALKAGALAVKQFAWYYTIVYRGGVDADGNCYDLQDNTLDQFYDPEDPRRVPSKSHLQAIAATWTVSVRKLNKQAGNDSRFFLTGYRAGKNVACGEERDGFRMYQKGIYYCSSDLPTTKSAPKGQHNLNFEQILRIYLNPNLEIVDPGSHDVIGEEQGDAATLTVADETAFAPRIYQSTVPPAVSPAGTSLVTLASAGLIATASVDVTYDGRDDLLALTATSDTAVRLDYAASDGAADYLPFATWWEGDLGIPVADVRLLTSDFTADGKVDAGLLLTTPPAEPAPAEGEPPAEPTAELVVVKQQKAGIAFADLVVVWSGPLDLAKSRTWAGDFNGDGAADLMIAKDVSEPGVSPTGMRFFRALSAPPAVGLGPLDPFLTAPDLSYETTLAAVGDVNRDGRDDLFLVYGAEGAATKVDVIRPSIKMTQRVPVYTASSEASLPISKLKVITADVNFDGLADLVIYRNRGEEGTSLVMLRSNYTKLKPFAALTDPTLDWSTARPY